MSTYYSDHDVTLLHGHVLDVLPTLATESINCVVTSPPYYGLRDYGVDGQIGLEPSTAEYVETMRAVFAEVRRALRKDGVLWLNLGDSYQTHDPGGWRQGEHLNPGGRQAAKGSGRNRAGTRAPGVGPKNLLGIPWRVAFALQGDGWTLRNAVIWHKPNAMPESVTDRLSTRYEHVFLFSKSRRYWFDLDAIREPIDVRADALTWEQRKDLGELPRHGLSGRAASGGRGTFASRLVRQDQTNYPEGTAPQSARSATGERHRTDYGNGGKNPGDVWAIPTQPFAGAHFATMPPNLVKRCILAGCPTGGTVPDPFAGSGTTLMVARQLGRKSVGVELNPAYLGIAVKRIGDPVLDFGEATA